MGESPLTRPASSVSMGEHDFVETDIWQVWPPSVDWKLNNLNERTGELENHFASMNQRVGDLAENFATRVGSVLQPMVAGLETALTQRADERFTHKEMEFVTFWNSEVAQVKQDLQNWVLEIRAKYPAGGDHMVLR